MSSWLEMLSASVEKYTKSVIQKRSQHCADMLGQGAVNAAHSWINLLDTFVLLRSHTAQRHIRAVQSASFPMHWEFVLDLVVAL